MMSLIGQEIAMPSAATSLLTRPATELAELVRSGQIRSRELVEAALERIGEMRTLNAFTLVDAEGALAAADAIQPGDPRPFAGIPIAIKELNAVVGQPLTMGSDLYGDYRPDAFSKVSRDGLVDVSFGGLSHAQATLPPVRDGQILRPRYLRRSLYEGLRGTSTARLNVATSVPSWL